MLGQTRPVRCKSCGALLAQVYPMYFKLLKEKSGRVAPIAFYNPANADVKSVHRQIIDDLGVVDVCCVKALLTLVEMG